MFDSEIQSLAFEVIALCTARALTVGTIESCTGGLIAGALTAIPGSSAVVMAGLVTYSNAAKTALAGVPANLILSHGAVSEEVARAMAEGGRMALGVDVACAVTGVAGPGGGSPAKPVGLVHLAVAREGHGTFHRICRYGKIGRDGVRREAVVTALEMLVDLARA
jgi:nicotinamide-nucleotide amidase